MVCQRIADRSGLSIDIARRDVLPFLSAMTHHCKPRELTVAMAAAYDLDETAVSFITGSGESTNKVESIVADAEELREDAIEEHAGGAFAGSTRGTDSDEPEPSDPDDDRTDAGEPSDAAVDNDSNASDDASDAATAADDDEDQAGLNDFM